MRFGKLALPLVVFALFTSCGYRLAARKGDAGAGQTIAVPTFANNTTSYRIEQRISEAVRKELARTTRYKVTSGEAGDVVVRGQVRDYSTTPTVVDANGRAAQYAMSVALKVLVTDTATGKTLLQNDSMGFRESFQLSPDAAQFVPEDPAALDRLAARFASAIVTALVHRP